MINTIDVNEVASGLIQTLSAIKPRVELPPAPLVALAKNIRSGLSAIAITSEILSKMERVGVPIGTLADGSESIDDKVIYHIVDTIIRHIQQNAKISVVIPPTAIQVVVTGTDATGTPITGTGISQNFTQGSAVIL